MNIQNSAATGALNLVALLSRPTTKEAAYSPKEVPPTVDDSEVTSKRQSELMPIKESFNDMIGVRQLIILKFDQVNFFPATSTISAWHNLTVTDDNRFWVDNGTGNKGTAFDLMEIVHGNSCLAEVEHLINRIRMYDVTEASSFEPEGDKYDLPMYGFPLERLPTKLRYMADGIMEMEGVDAVLAASAVIGAASASLGNGIEIQTKNDKTACGNLFFLLDAQSGAGKSSASERAAGPVRDFEKAENLKREQRRRELASMLTRKERDYGKSLGNEGEEQQALEIEQIREELEKLKQPSYVIVGDTTTEKLMAICSENGGAAASFSGEARGIVQVLAGRYDKGNPNDSFYLSAFSVEPCRQDRLGRASSSVDRPCLSVMWMVQPTVFNRMWANESFLEGGLLPRFLCCRTNTQIKECSDERKVFPPTVLEAYHRIITELLETYRSNHKSPFQVEVSARARKIIINYTNHIVARRNAREFSDTADVFASRWAELTWKMALVFHTAEYGCQAHQYEVQPETAMSALSVVSWFALQQMRLVEEQECKQEDLAESKILALVSKNGRVTARTVAKVGIFKNAPQALSMLRELEDQGLLVSELSHGKGRPTRHFLRPPNKIGGK